MKKIYLSLLSIIALQSFAQKSDLRTSVSKKADALEQKVISWRRDFHEHPELGNNEFRTAGIITKHLQSLGIDVQTGVAKTGVVGVLKGGKPGPVVALRADMDGLPVTERVDVPFASKVKTQYNGQEVGVMHACGHDSHVAILMGVAEVLASMKKDIQGTVKFIFQPAEEGAPEGEEGGAALMIKEGVLENPKVDAIFGLHINSQTAAGDVTYKPGGTMAAVNDMKITIKGKQAHGAYPWSSIDPIVISAQIVNNLQTIVSRNLNVTENPGVVTIGSIVGGVRSNIIPEKVEMLGTVRNFSAEDEKMFINRIKTIVTKTAEAGGATAEIKIPYSNHYPVTFNNVQLTEKMLPSMQATAGKAHVKLRPPVTGAEDFSFFQEKVPGLFVFLGGMPKEQNPLQAPSHHTPDFYLDESGFILGVKLLSNLTLDYMALKK
ncbi:amidohydrolase [Pedobacter sp. AW1-32]|uniref:amidohydrolase n=1 Tax=Pedobacter sp. AW1-32 TaxID=3383026 RepID=UPI003FF090B3